MDKILIMVPASCVVTDGVYGISDNVERVLEDDLCSQILTLVKEYLAANESDEVLRLGRTAEIGDGVMVLELQRCGSCKLPVDPVDTKKWIEARLEGKPAEVGADNVSPSDERLHASFDTDIDEMPAVSVAYTKYEDATIRTAGDESGSSDTSASDDRSDGSGNPDDDVGLDGLMEPYEPERLREARLIVDYVQEFSLVHLADGEFVLVHADCDAVPRPLEAGTDLSNSLWGSVPDRGGIAIIHRYRVERDKRKK